jgi:hypothetical protein
MRCHPKPIGERHHFSRWLLHHQLDDDICAVVLSLPMVFLYVFLVYGHSSHNLWILKKWAMVLPCFTYGFTCDVAIWVYRRDVPTHETRSLQGAKQHKTTTSYVSWPQVAWNCNVVNPAPKTSDFGSFWKVYTIHFWFNWRWLIVFEYWVISGLPHYLPTRTWVLS